jgi:ATP-dependent Clp protease ATP-binding subunit ClpA
VTVAFSPEAKEVMHRGFASARAANHLSMTVEHLVLEMLREKAVVDYLAKCGTNLEALKALLGAKVASFRTAQIQTVETQGNTEFTRMIRRAIDDAGKERRPTVLLHDLFLAILEEPTGFTAQLLVQQTAHPQAFEALRTERARLAKKS